MTLTWYALASSLPGFSARRALRRGRRALAGHAYPKAARYFKRAAAYEPLREDAVCLLAEAALRDRRPSDALYAINTLLMEHETVPPRGSAAPPVAAPPTRSPRVRLLRALAGCMLGRGLAARRELAEVVEHTLDHRVATAQACLIAGDAAGALEILEGVAPEAVSGALATRVQLCRAAAWYRLGAWTAAQRALPAEECCTRRDAATVRRVREEIARRAERVE